MNVEVDSLQGQAQELKEQFAPQIEEARRNLDQMNERAISFIKERPGTCLLGALAVGYVIGKIASR